MTKRSWCAAALALVLASSTGVATASAATATAPDTASHSSTAKPQRDRPDLNGLRIKAVNSPNIYLVLDGKRHWIPNPATYNNLFRDWNGVVSVLDVGDITAGSALSDGAFLGKASGRPEVYLFSNGVKRWITSPAVMDKYYFAWNRIQDLPAEAVNSVPNGPYIS
ncbi:hypothetical protein [Streptomyces hesseae]|uniref:Uncharacterized protein n=1 Tax=Streptomyces hesseae TaxID=3075519 RepID=A0ABU2SVY3_9ACTN|nr:hypothetical protein [Streptomyces sp. DSM 40473]MDT0453162.1 hypothetical protein [Streptomyces sp. DSM 40473]